MTELFKDKPQAAMASDFSIISNPLAAVAQLQTSGSQLDGIPADLERSIFFAGASLTQAASVLLRLPQDIIAKAIITFQRFWLGAEGGSLKDYGAEVVKSPKNKAFRADNISGYISRMYLPHRQAIISSRVAT